MVINTILIFFHKAEDVMMQTAKLVRISDENR